MVRYLRFVAKLWHGCSLGPGELQLTLVLFNMQSKLIRTLLGAAAGLALIATAARADLINGVITFDGSVLLNGPIGTATGINAGGWQNTKVEDVSGDFTPLVSSGDTVSISAPWSFNSGPISNFWNVSLFYFDLDSSSIDYQSSMFLSVSGKGTVYSGGLYDPTPGIWTFSTQGPASSGKFSFSASASAPDGGTTAILLGSGLMVLACFRSRRRWLA